MHRFFLLDTPLQPGRTVDLAPIAHQLRNVLRLNVGVRIVLLDGNGAAYGAEITRLERESATGLVLDVHAATSNEPGSDVEGGRAMQLEATKQSISSRLGQQFGIVVADQERDGLPRAEVFA